MKIIGIGGTNGSGKDTVGQILAEQCGFLFVSATDILRAELTRRGLTTIRENMRNLSAEWRREHGVGVLIDKAIEVYGKSGGAHTGLAVASLRNPGEADRVHELGGQVVWVDAEPQIRYARVEARARGPEDHKTFKQFLADEQAEMQYSGDAATLSMAGVKDRADIFITNNGNGLDELAAEIKKALKL